MIKNKMNKRVTTCDGTNIYLAQGNGLRKIVISTGVDTTLNALDWVSLSYGNSILYGATKDSIYSIHVTTGVATLLGRVEDVTSIIYVSADLLFVTTINSGFTFVPSTEAIDYISQVL